MKHESFFCPLYKNSITEYDCDEISFCAETGYLINDGLPHLHEKDVILKNKNICFGCCRRIKNNK